MISDAGSIMCRKSRIKSAMTTLLTMYGANKKLSHHDNLHSVDTRIV